MFKNFSSTLKAGPYKSFSKFWAFLFACMAFNFIWPFESYLSMWLSNIGKFDSASIGLTFSSMAFIGMILEPMIGYLADRVMLKKYLMYGVGIISILAGPFIYFVIMPLSHAGFNHQIVALSLGMYLGICCNVGLTIFNQYLRRASYVNGFDFGWALSGLSLVTIFGPILAGALLNKFPTYFVFTISLTGFIFFLLVLSFRFDKSNMSIIYDEGNSKKKVSIREISHTLKSKKFIGLVVFVITCVSTNNIVGQQLGVYAGKFFATPAQATAAFTLMNVFAGIIGLFSMWIFPPFIKKISPRSSLLIYSALMSIYLFTLAFAHNWTFVIIGNVIFATLAGPFWNIACTTYVFHLFKKNEYATIQTLSTYVASELGQLVFASLAGFGYTQFGFKHTYFALGLIILFSFVWGYFMLEKSDSEANLVEKNMQKHDNQTVNE